MEGDTRSCAQRTGRAHMRCAGILSSAGTASDIPPVLSILHYNARAQVCQRGSQSVQAMLTRRKPILSVYAGDGRSDSFLNTISDMRKQVRILQDLGASAGDCKQDSRSMTRLGEYTETFPKRIHDLNGLRRMLMLIPMNSSSPPQHHTMSHP